MAVAAAALSALAGGLHGSLVRPGDPEYRSVRKPFIGRFDDALPAAVVRRATADDVVASLAFARTHDLPFALRSGGHSFADWSSTRGLVIDLGPLDTVRLDGPTATVGPGALAARLAAADRTVPCGWCPGVGAAGAVLGGGTACWAGCTASVPTTCWPLKWRSPTAGWAGATPSASRTCSGRCAARGVASSAR